MCTGAEAMIISSVIAGGASMATASMAPSAPSMPAMPSQEPIKQAEKSADASVANRIKATKSKMGSVATPRTMLSGTMGVGDEELNLGGKSLV
tara:strand:+ start:91 stop:369 length:279 start_codon:yes stop_codon:yes gene_type:complete